jgi:hypothetical protein
MFPLTERPLVRASEGQRLIHLSPLARWDFAPGLSLPPDMMHRFMHWVVFI